MACQPGELAWTDGSKTYHGAGWAVVTPGFQRYGRPTEPQTSYKGGLMGYCQAGELLSDAMIVLDNQAVQKVAHQPLHRGWKRRQPRRHET